MAAKKTSINDIAKHLNVAKSTVSFIINGKAEERRISKELEKRVLDYVNEIGFKPHHLAQSLATGRSNSIGLIVENIGDSFFGPIALKIEEKAKKSGYRIVYSSTLGDSQSTKEILRFFRETQLDAYIIAPPLGVEDAIKEVIEEGRPVVVFDRRLEGLETNYVGTNNQEAAYEACVHMLDQGFERVAFITLDSDQSQMKERLSGYLQGMADHHLQAYILKIPYDFAREDRQGMIAHYIKDNPEVDALFFATNYLCIDGLEVTKNLGKAIPQDIGVIVFDEHDIFRLYSPAITAVKQPLEKLSETIIDMLLNKISSKKSQPPFIEKIVPSTLVVRESTIKRK
ncbi:LacI family DNA-binding transcriptional regulator [Olivibacter sitiensis]|uniref:LacI family DNA-binding transcriptional regulator n=1 Tax=Olivibacter sitiensis TaxID=376470 RepID=UPI0004820CBA|nr:LacI family DNA-binding transcriptional regulator [Olivibacter sitiensis]